MRCRVCDSDGLVSARVALRKNRCGQAYSHFCRVYDMPLPCVLLLTHPTISNQQRKTAATKTKERIRKRRNRKRDKCAKRTHKSTILRALLWLKPNALCEHPACSWWTYGQSLTAFLPQPATKKLLRGTQDCLRSAAVPDHPPRH